MFVHAALILTTFESAERSVGRLTRSQKDIQCVFPRYSFKCLLACSNGFEFLLSNFIALIPLEKPDNLCNSHNIFFEEVVIEFEATLIILMVTEEPYSFVYLECRPTSVNTCSKETLEFPKLYRVEVNAVFSRHFNLFIYKRCWLDFNIIIQGERVMEVAYGFYGKIISKSLPLAGRDTST